MRISGYTFVRDADKFYLPIRPAIESVLPIVDEFIVALGAGESGDATRATLESIGSAKLRIIATEWDVVAYPHNTEYARQSDIAKSACTGDWLFYIQGDEVLPEWHHQLIREQCEQYVAAPGVEGFLFHYRHFWGDYRHVHDSAAWYAKEIRIIRNRPDIHSWRDAQSFRAYTGPCHTADDYLRKRGTRKLDVVELNAYIHHYGFVRPPNRMSAKSRRMHETYHGMKAADKIRTIPDVYDYGDLRRIPVYAGPHPRVMAEWIAKFDWQDRLEARASLRRKPIHKHERRRYRVLTWIERRVFGGRRLGGFNNYRIVARAGTTTAST